MKYDPIRFAEFLHPEMDRTFREDDKYQCHAGIFGVWNDSDLSEKLFTKDEFFPAFNSVQGKSDFYFSVNSFYHAHRKTDAVRHLNAIVIDYDFYKMDQFRDLSAAEMYEKHIKSSLPADPSFVVDSGRGLYVIYAVYHCPYHLSDLYKSVVSELQKQQASFGADPKATLITQIIRIPGTVNSKSGRTVTVIDWSEKRYRLPDLADLILPFTREQVAIWKEKKNESRRTVKKTYRQSAFEKDLEKLISIRNASGIRSGYREQLIYFYWESLLWTKADEGTIAAKISRMNSLFLDPLSDKELFNQCRPARKYDFRTSKKKIITRLEITNDEMKKMNYLISASESNRKSMRLKRRSMGKTEKERSMKERRENIIRLLGVKKIEEMADLFGVSKKTILRDLKYISDHLAQFQSVLNEVMRKAIRTASDFIQMAVSFSCDVTWSGIPEIKYSNGCFILL